MRYIKQYIVILYEQYIQVLVPVHIHIGYVHIHVVSANSPMTTKVSQIYYPNDYAYILYMYITDENKSID